MEPQKDNCISSPPSVNYYCNFVAIGGRAYLQDCAYTTGFKATLRTCGLSNPFNF